MATDNQITAALFSAFVKCPTKAYLLVRGEPAPDSYFAEMMARVSSTYENIASRQLFDDNEEAELCTFDQLSSDQNGETTRFFDRLSRQ
jgi:hypothetical protein